MNQRWWLCLALGTSTFAASGSTYAFDDRLLAYVSPAASQSRVSSGAQSRADVHSTRSLGSRESEGATGDPAILQQAQQRYGRLPMHFERNGGQTADEVRYLARGPGYTFFLTDSEAVMALSGASPDGETAAQLNERTTRPISRVRKDAMSGDSELGVAVVRIRLEGATRNPKPNVEGSNRLAGVSNYFIGDDVAKWRTGIPQFQKVRYQGVYHGIDLVYYGTSRELEYDFVLSPGADPDQIRIAFDGVDGLVVTDEGHLTIRVRGREIVQRAPRIYQDVGGERHEIAGRYRLVPGKNPAAMTDTAALEPIDPLPRVGFTVASYDMSRPLIIDPVIVYSSYLGGSGFDSGPYVGVAVDADGNAYIASQTQSTNFPTRKAIYPHLWGGGDGFITKINASGTALVYSTYIGGSGYDGATAIAVDRDGNAYVTGETRSLDFPKVHARYPNLWGYADAFVFKLDPSGTVPVYSTYLGGSDGELGSAIAVDGSGNAHVTGTTNSSDFPRVNPLYPNLWGESDAFIFKISGNGQKVIFSTYLGGSGQDGGSGIAVDRAGNVYVTGTTTSQDFPTMSALYSHLRGSADAFVFKVNPSGTRVRYSTYLGGPGSDLGTAIAVDEDGDAYVTGHGDSGFPTVNALYSGAYCGAFVSKLGSNGTALVYSTCLRGSEAGFGIAVDDNTNAFVTGWTFSQDFLEVDPILPNPGGFPAAFLTKINASGDTADYSTTLGVNGGSSGRSVALDRSGNVFVAGQGFSGGLPLVSPLHAYHGNGDAFIAKIANSNSSGSEVDPEIRTRL